MTVTLSCTGCGRTFSEGHETHDCLTASRALTLTVAATATLLLLSFALVILAWKCP